MDPYGAHGSTWAILIHAVPMDPQGALGSISCTWILIEGVYKEDVDDVTRTNLVKLNHDERIVEIAQMLGGIEMSSSAIAHAKELLN